MGFFNLAKSSTRTRSPEASSPTTLFKPLWTRSKPIERSRPVKLSICFEQRFNPIALEEACSRAIAHADRAPAGADLAPLLDTRSPLELLAQMTTAEGRRHRATRYNSVPAPPLACADGPLTGAFAPDEEAFVRSASDDLCEMYTPRPRGGAFEPTPVVRGSPSNVVPSIFAVPNSPSFAVSCVMPSYDTWVAGLTSMKFATEVFTLISLETAKNTPGIRYRPEGFEMA